MPISDRDFVQLGRIAMQGDTASAVALVRRTARRLSKTDPDLASELVALTSGANVGGVRRAAPLLPIDSDSRLQLVRYEETPELSGEPIWVSPLDNLLSSVIIEREHADELTAAGLSPPKSLLFVGPPGVGKTLAARWLARNLGLPLLTLDLAAVMSSYLGRTGNNLRSVLDHASKSPCLLLLDEFDAVAKRRGDEVEVGELKRLVTVLLQSIDEWPPHGLLIAATNHPELLDPAAWRRFDVVMAFPMPGASAVKQAIQQMLLGRFEVSDKVLNALSETFSNKSFADVKTRLQRALRASVVGKRPAEETLCEILSEDIGSLSKQDQIRRAVLLTECGFTQTQASDKTGVSRNTIRKHSNEKV